jgi:hypothetical protein
MKLTPRAGAPTALGYVAQRRARGKVVIIV